jgi:hypothetical protein
MAGGARLGPARWGGEALKHCGRLRQRLLLAALVNIVDHADCSAELLGCLEQTHSVLDGPKRQEISEGWANDGIGELDRGERPGIDLTGRVDHGECTPMVRAAGMIQFLSLL